LITLKLGHYGGIWEYIGMKGVCFGVSIRKREFENENLEKLRKMKIGKSWQ
jgi:hypothetical protein